MSDEQKGPTRATILLHRYLVARAQADAALPVRAEGGLLTPQGHRAVTTVGVRKR